MRIDTYKIIKRLTSANIIEKHAEAIAEEITIANQNCNSTDMLDIKLAELKAIIEARLERLRAELLKWFVGISIVQTSSLIITTLLS